MSIGYSRKPFHLLSVAAEAARPQGTPASVHTTFLDKPHTSDIGFLYEGTTGNDSQTGSGNDDDFNYWQGGNDTLNGSGGNDNFFFGDAFDKLDSVNGGDGNDTLHLDGEYDAAVDYWLPTTLVSVETIELGAGHFYRFGLNDANVAAGATLTIDGHSVGSNGFGFFGQNETNGRFIIEGSKAGDGLFVGYGADVVNGNGGDDVVWTPDSSLQLKTLDGGQGSDTAAPQLSGGATMVLTDTTLVNFEKILFQPDANLGTIGVTLDMADGNVKRGQTFLIEQQGTTGTDISLFFDGSAETDGQFEVHTINGDDTVTGGHRADRFESFGSGLDRYYGGAGNDYLRDWGGWDSTDEFNGGQGNDTLEMRGDYSGGVEFGVDALVSVENVVLTNIGAYALTFNDGNVARNQTMTVDAHGLFGANYAYLNASAETNGSVVFLGGGAADILVGGARADTLTANGGNDIVLGNGGADHIDGGDGDDLVAGNGGADILTGGIGKDIYQLDIVSDSTGANFDEIVGFDFAAIDSIGLNGLTVTGIDHRVTAGNLRAGSNFNHDLANAIGKNELAPHHAVLFQPDAGAFVGDTFLIIDANGRAGYQANKDFVVLLTDWIHLNQLDTTDFTVVT